MFIMVPMKSCPKVSFPILLQIVNSDSIRGLFPVLKNTVSKDNSIITIIQWEY